MTKKNENISLLYIAYQFAMMASSILTPGTIFIMIVGAVNTAYPEIPLFGSLFINVVPVAIFSLLVFFAKSSTQVGLGAAAKAKWCFEPLFAKTLCGLNLHRK